MIHDLEKEKLMLYMITEEESVITEEELVTYNGNNQLIKKDENLMCISPSYWKDWGQKVDFDAIDSKGVETNTLI